MEWIVYQYKNCDSCRKALRWLKEHEIEAEVRQIRETPPTRDELAAMLTYLDGDLRKLFNTAGGDYREMGLKDTLPGMSDEEAFKLLSANGNLVKRPFLLGSSTGTVGFKPDIWAELVS